MAAYSGLTGIVSADTAGDSSAPSGEYIMPNEVLVIHFKRQKETDKTIHIAGRQQFPESRL